MELNPVDSPIATSSLTTGGVENALEMDDLVPETAMDRTHDARQAVDSNDSGLVFVDLSNTEGDPDYQRSMLSAINDGLGAIVNGYL